MSDNNDVLNKLNYLKDIKPYEGVTWSDGNAPPLSATNLNKSEDALKQLLLNLNNSGEGAIQQIVDVLDATFKQINGDAEQQVVGLVTKVNTNKSNIDSIDERVTSNSTKITNNVSKITDLTSSLRDLSYDVSNNTSNIESLDTSLTDLYNEVNINTDNIYSLDTEVATNTESIKSLQGELKSIKDNVAGLIGDNIVQNGNEVILRCGTSTEVLFGDSE